MIKANLPTFFVILVLMIGAVWIVVNWSYNTVLASKSGQIELQDRQLADYREKLHGATPDEAKARIDALEARLSRIEPRQLSAEQRSIIAGLVEVPAGMTYSFSIQSDMSCADCNQYATDFQAVLGGARWTLQMPKVMAAAAASPKGIAVLTPDPSNPLPEAAALARALTAAKIPFDLKPGVNSFHMSFGGGVQPPMAAMLITARSSL